MVRGGGCQEERTIENPFQACGYDTGASEGKHSGRGLNGSAPRGANVCAWGKRGQALARVLCTRILYPGRVVRDQIRLFDEWRVKDQLGEGGSTRLNAATEVDISGFGRHQLSPKTFSLERSAG